MECIASVLDVQANRVDHAVGARNGGLYRALVMCVGGDLFDVAALSPCVYRKPKLERSGDEGRRGSRVNKSSVKKLCVPKILSVLMR